MHLKVRCPKCDKSLRVGIEHAGKRAKCSSCGEPIQIPSREKMEQALGQASGKSMAPPPPVPEPAPTAAGNDDLWGDLPDTSAAPAATPAAPANNPFGAPNPYASPTATGERDRVQYADFGTRFVALLIDQIILFGVGLVVGFIFGFVFAMAIIGNGGNIEDAEVLLNVLSQLLGMLISLLYFAGMESSLAGATIGKKAMKIRVVSTDGQRISYLNAVGRWFAKILSGLILLIGYIMAAFTERKQALHDMLASTLVVKA